MAISPSGPTLGAGADRDGLSPDRARRPDLSPGAEAQVRRDRGTGNGNARPEPGVGGLTGLSFSLSPRHGGEGERDQLPDFRIERRGRAAVQLAEGVGDELEQLHGGLL